MTRRDYKVATPEELLSALKQAKPGEVVYVDDKAEIDISGKQRIVIPGGVTLASGRGIKGSQGALIYTDNLQTSPLFLPGGEKVRITGLRLWGPDQHRRRNPFAVPLSRGIQSSYPHLEVDNCELWGWSLAAIFLSNGATKAYIHHNYMHHNQRFGKGYGVWLNQADALIEANIFDWCRHCIAGSGREGCSYEACYNIILEDAFGHSFDMHGGSDSGDGTNFAGSWIKIHHNTFKAGNTWAVVIRGEPREKAEIHHNWFASYAKPDVPPLSPLKHPVVFRAVKEVPDNGHVYQNVYGPDRLLK